MGGACRQNCTEQLSLTPRPFGEKLTILNSVYFSTCPSFPFLLNGGFGLFFFNLSLFPAFSPSLCHACNRHQQTVIQCSSFAPKFTGVLRRTAQSVPPGVCMPAAPVPHHQVSPLPLRTSWCILASAWSWAFGGSGWAVFCVTCSTCVICLRDT